MPKSVLLMVGHWNIENITSEGLRPWRSAANLKKSTGASGERDYHWKEIMPRLRDKLIKVGVQVYITDAIYHKETYSRDYDLMVALHYDGGGTENRCMISQPNPSASPKYITDTANQKSVAFINKWKNIYPPKTGVTYRPERVTNGMTDYYGFDYVGVNTPTALIEHFNHTSPKGAELKGNPELVAQADFEAICEFLDIHPTLPAPTPPPVTPPQPSEVDQLKQQVLELNAKIKRLEEEKTGLQSSLNSVREENNLFKSTTQVSDRTTREFITQLEAQIKSFKESMKYV